MKITFMVIWDASTNKTRGAGFFMTYITKDGGKCILCTDGDNQSMGGALFDTAEDAIEAWNKRYKEG